MSATNLRVLVTGTAGRVARAAAGDRGSSLILVIGLTMAVTLTVVTLSGYALSGYVTSKQRADWTTAVAAAQAGIDDYVARLNENELYWTTGQTDTTNSAFTSWTPVPGARNQAAFRYSVDISATPSKGYVTVTSSGRVDGEVRTIQATLKRGRFLDFVYYSDYETGDPANPLFYSGSYWRNRDPAAVCGVYNWAAGWNTRNPNCPRIYWRDDVVVGRFHTNDTFFASGRPVFRGTVSSGCPVVAATDPCNRRTLYVPDPANGADPDFASAPTGGSILPMPASNAAIRREADPALGGRGCLFTGPTRIVFLPNGRVAVDSPNTVPGSTPCGTGPNATLPPNGVIYVENLPAGRPPADCTRPWVGTPMTVSLDATSGGRSYPRTDDRTPYDCRAGDVFVEGTLAGQVTIATANNVVVTGNLRYANGSSGTDVLGLVAENNVSIYHPVDSSGREVLGNAQMRDPEIWAATLSVLHSINVQNYQAGTPKGSLRIRGSIAQRWRGAVGQFSGRTTISGYAKDWQYDPRLVYLSPPKFLDPVAASWLPIEQAELPPAFPG